MIDYVNNPADNQKRKMKPQIIYNFLGTKTVSIINKSVVNK